MPLIRLSPLNVATASSSEVDRNAIGWTPIDRPDDGHECSPRLYQAGGPLADVTANDIEHQIDSAHVFQRVVVEVHELVHPKRERLFTVSGAAGTDDVGADFSSELCDHCPDCPCRAVCEYALACPQPPMHEKPLPRR